MPLASTMETKSLIKVNMAGIGYIQAPGELETLLGSCVGIALWDRSTKWGGLAHIVLPESQGKTDTPGKYADTAVVEMRKYLISMGANPSKLTAKIAGGAKMFGKAMNGDVGSRNIEATLRELDKHRIPVLAQHVGENNGRVIRFSLEDGSVAVFVGRQQVAVI